MILVYVLAATGFMLLGGGLFVAWLDHCQESYDPHGLTRENAWQRHARR